MSRAARPRSRAPGASFDRLVEAALAVRAQAYAPYSRFLVGAAVLSSSGVIYTGCNVENASYGATVCAERNAIAQMVAAGERSAVACAVVTKGKDPAAPCGLCRQVLYEFADDMPVLLIGLQGARRTRIETTLAALLPRGFRMRTGR